MCIQTRKQLRRTSKAMDISQKHLFGCKYLQASYLSHFVQGCLISVCACLSGGGEKCVAPIPFQFSNQTSVQRAKGNGMCMVNTNVGNAPASPVSKHAQTACPEDKRGLPAADAVTSGQWCSLAFARAKSLSELCALQLRLPPRGWNLHF